MRGNVETWEAWVDVLLVLLLGLMVLSSEHETTKAVYTSTILMFAWRRP